MSNANNTGRCEAMQKYELCKNTTPCGSADYSPKCESILDGATCDFYQSSHRCRCIPPGPLVEAEGDGGLKTPTTTK